MGDRLIDPIEIETACRCDLVELIGDGKLDVPPDIGKELRQLRLSRIQANHIMGERQKELPYLLKRYRIKRRDDLRQTFQLFDGFAFSDPLRTERNPGLFAGRGKQAFHFFRCARIDCAPEDDVLIVPDHIHDTGKEPFEHGELGV